MIKNRRNRLVTLAAIGSLATLGSYAGIAQLVSEDPAPTAGPTYAELRETHDEVPGVSRNLSGGAMPNGFAPNRPGVPCEQATQLPLTDLLTLTPAALGLTAPAVLPAGQVAKPTKAWRCGSPAEPVVLLDNGIELSFESGFYGIPDDKAAQTALEGIAEFQGGTVGRAGNTPAYIDLGDGTERPTTVLVIYREIKIGLAAYTDTADKLLATAESIIANFPQRTGPLASAVEPG